MFDQGVNSHLWIFSMRKQGVGAWDFNLSWEWKKKKKRRLSDTILMASLLWTCQIRLEFQPVIVDWCSNLFSCWTCALKSPLLWFSWVFSLANHPPGAMHRLPSLISLTNLDLVTDIIHMTPLSCKTGSEAVFLYPMELSTTLWGCILGSKQAVARV